LTLTFEEVAFFTGNMTGTFVSPGVYDYSSYTTQDVTMPATVDAGDVLFAAIDRADQLGTPPSGWTLLSYEGNAPMAMYGRIADGAEDGATVTFPLSFAATQGTSTLPFAHAVARYSRSDSGTFGTGFNQFELSPTEFDFSSSGTDYRSGIGATYAYADVGGPPTVGIGGDGTSRDTATSGDRPLVWWDDLNFGLASSTVTITSTGPDAIPSLGTLYVSTVYDLLVAAFTFAPNGATAPATVNFTDTSTDAPDQWAWDFGDAGTSTSENPSHTYASPGEYEVTLSVTRTATSSTDSVSHFVTVNGPEVPGSPNPVDGYWGILAEGTDTDAP
jgi:plastocyanin